MKQDAVITLPYTNWWHSEFSRPLIRSTLLVKFSGLEEFSLRTIYGTRTVCKVILLPPNKSKKNTITEPTPAYCDTITGAIYFKEDHRVIGKPFNTGRTVPDQSIRSREAENNAVKPVVYTQGDSND